MLILRGTAISPYVRKVRLAAALLGLTQRIKLSSANPLDENDSLKEQNPLGKIPALVLDNGEVLYDSLVIVQYLDDLAGGGQLLPSDGMKRCYILRDHALIDGVVDAAVLRTAELRRLPEQQSSEWIANQEGKIARGLDYITQHLAKPLKGSPNLAQITLACCLPYLDLRYDGQWREDYPILVDWFNDFAEKVPVFIETETWDDQN